ncbi:MAG TPA: hypothetical protein VKE74_09690 [Gemmataceae bacterium]|nr:hypothetical protein [Gemmataceae bacterium]
MIVVKVGGSLYAHPRLGPGLRAFLETLPSPVLLVPGGGPFADAVRQLDAVHRLGEERAHRLALTSLWAAAAFLRDLVPGAASASHPDTDLRVPVRVLDAHAFCRSDNALPHSWAVTSDSIAARAAVVYRADRLILLKSIDIPPGTPWPVAAMNGWVDAHFPHLAANAPFRIEVVNFRQRLEQSSRPA